MVIEAAIREWSKSYSWQTNEMVEQDLIICRALVALFNDEYLTSHLAFRGGTTLHKLYIQPQKRYSSDIDLVQIKAEPIKETIERVRQALSFLGNQAIQKKAIRVMLPTFGVMFILWALTIIFGVTYGLHPFWGVLGFVTSVLLIIPLYSFLFAKWAIWTFEHVADFHEFIRKGRIGVGKYVFPTKYCVCSKIDKEKWRKIVEFRMKHPIFELFDDYTIPKELTISGSRSANFIFFLLFSFFSLYPLPKHHTTKDILIAIPLFMIALYFIYKSFNPLVISEKGIWNKKNGFQSWDNIQEAYVDMRVGQGYNGATSYVLVVHYKNLSKQGNKWEHILSEKAMKIDFAIKMYQQRYAKNENI